MKQVLLSGQGAIQVVECPVPARLTNSVLVRNRFSLISSGTEGAAVTRYSGLLGIYEKVVSSKDRVQQVWEMARTSGLRRTLDSVHNKLADLNPVGYSSVGTVIEVDGDPMPFKPGDIVACMGTGFANHAEYVVIPRNLAARVPDGVSLEQAAFAALGCIAMQGIRRLQLTPGESVGVLGLGLIGQISLRLLTAMGYRACGVDVSPERVGISKLAANVDAWQLDESEVMHNTLKFTNGAGLDGVLVCAATDDDSPVNLAFDLCRRSGRVSIVGDVGLNLKRAKMYAKELDIGMSCSYGPGRYDVDYELHGRDYEISHVRWSEGRNLEHFLWMINAGVLDVGDLVSACFNIDDAIEAYSKIKTVMPPCLACYLTTASAEIYPTKRKQFAKIAVSSIRTRHRRR